MISEHRTDDFHLTGLALSAHQNIQEPVRKQHHTARRIYNRLTEGCGFTGSESSILKALWKLKAQHGIVEAYVPLYFAFGSAMQKECR